MKSVGQMQRQGKGKNVWEKREGVGSHLWIAD
jgi:hypothetical protein